MAITRDIGPDGTGTALMVLKTDTEPPKDLLDKLRATPNILRVKSLILPPRNQ